MLKIQKKKVGRNRLFQSKRRLLVESHRDLYRTRAIQGIHKWLRKEEEVAGGDKVGW